MHALILLNIGWMGRKIVGWMPPLTHNPMDIIVIQWRMGGYMDWCYSPWDGWMDEWIGGKMADGCHQSDRWINLHPSFDWMGGWANDGLHSSIHGRVASIHVPIYQLDGWVRGCGWIHPSRHGCSIQLPIHKLDGWVSVVVAFIHRHMGLAPIHPPLDYYSNT